MRNKTAVLVTVAAATLACGVLAGCNDARPDAEPRTSAASATSATAAVPAPLREAPVPTDAAPKRADASPDARLTVAGVRIGSHEGFDRVVYDLGGSGTPGWVVEYTDRAVQDGSGRELDVAGDSVLEVRITGSAYPFDSGVSPYSGPDPVTDPAVPGIVGVSSPLVFEGISQSFIGVTGERPAFSVTALSNPTRLVIDIATAG
ncbi:hypothetical protein IU449_12710 [Nocardia higoensis]|uniref:AMIN-like domain-containing protein n=1 Tax=Nocardia higoensis TaxID=228599 RepID=A0ABS0DEQ7_9NOCA|nr:hypothetical protein [Nocardia higoensis]MBF6355394.1 hypothetical protein [Nocardia higoensis]